MRTWFLRALGGVFFFAFGALFFQVQPLLGSDGLTPMVLYQERVLERYQWWDAFFLMPSLFWQDASDTTLVGAAGLGVLLSGIAIGGIESVLLWGGIWVLYLSFGSLGQVWLGFGWDILLCETALLAVFMSLGRDNSSQRWLRWAFAWLGFRLMFGAGLIKLRGDSCWQELTCLDYHYQTQPSPSPLSWYFDALPSWADQAGVLFNHIAELGLPFFLFVPALRNVGVFGMIIFQVLLILSGNLAFFNYLSIAVFLGALEPTRWPFRRVPVDDPPASGRLLLQRLGVIGYLVGVVFNSADPLLNLFDENQAMNRAWGAFRVVNSYGAFGSVNRERLELIFEGRSLEGEWKEYGFVCKPGAVTQRPCWAGPYHRRLDWQLWFAGMSGVQRQPWVVNMVWKLLHNDAGLLSLIASNPFEDRPPDRIRVLRYKYQFGKDVWWEREKVGVFLGEVGRDSPELIKFVDENDWGWRRVRAQEGSDRKLP